MPCSTLGGAPGVSSSASIGPSVVARQPDVDPPQRAVARRGDAAVLHGVADDHALRAERRERRGQPGAVDVGAAERAGPHRAVVGGQRRGRLAGLAVEPAPRGPVDVVDAVDPVAEHAGVREHGVADDRDHRVAGEPPGVAAAGAERGDPAAQLRGDLDRRCRAGDAVERVEPGRRDVAEVAGAVHQLVVAEQRDEPAARGAGLGLQPGDEIEQRVLVVAAVEHVAGLDHDEVAADPAIAIVDRAGRAQRRASAAEVAVQIADRDQPLWRRQPQRHRRERAARRERRCGRGSGRAGGAGRAGGDRRRGLVVGAVAIAGRGADRQPGGQPGGETGRESGGAPGGAGVRRAGAAHRRPVYARRARGAPSRAATAARSRPGRRRR